MPWAEKRQAMIALGALGLILVAVIASWFIFFYKTPTCADEKQNQNETGIDCGGVCSRLCQAPRVSALWSRAVRVAPGVYHAVAYVQNPETSAGTKALPYTFSLYNAENILIAQRDGVMSLDPGEVRPLLETNVVTGERVPVRTFVEFHPAVWERGERVQSSLVIDSELLDSEALTLSARVKNEGTSTIPRVVLTALLFDASDMVVAASQTILTDVAPRAELTPVFTWQEPFASPVVRSVVTARLK